MGSFSDWNPITREEALKGSDMATYAASKTLAEHAVWDFAAQHKELDITTCKPLCHGLIRTIH
jgi:nucleoside-diphosphate-sugar epimerase